MFRLINQFTFLFFVASIIGSARGDSVTLTSIADTHLRESNPDNNAGGNPDFASGTNLSGKRSRGLVQFNLAGQIPANASIQSVLVTLTCTQIPLNSSDSTFDLRRVLVSWGEGTGTSSNDAGRPALTGEATWNNRFHPSTPWSAAGAAAPADFSSTVSASKPIHDVGGYTFGSTAALVADVKQWLSDSATNFGWIVVSEAEGTAGTHRLFGSRQNSTSSARPTLFVQYVIPVTPEITSIQETNGTIQFVFTALAGQPYTVEYRDSFATGSSWATFTTIDPQPATGDVTVTDPAPPTQRFYRVTTTF